jgi:hypothetical protein
MTSRTVLSVWAVLFEAMQLACSPAAKPAAVPSAGESAFQEIQTTIQSSLVKISQSDELYASSREEPAGQPAEAGQSNDPYIQVAAGAQWESAMGTSFGGAQVETSALGTSWEPPGIEPQVDVPRRPYEGADHQRGYGQYGASVEPAWRRNDAGGHANEAARARAAAALDLLRQSQADNLYLHSLSTRMRVPVEYSESIRQQNSLLLYNLGAGGPLTPQALDRVKAVALDFHTKALHARKTEAAAFRPVAVKVRTYRGGKEANGYEVWYVAAGYCDDASHFQRFGRFSSPTSKMLISGSYCVWAKMPNGATGQPEVFGIGHGTPAEELDLNAP